MSARVEERLVVAVTTLKSIEQAIGEAVNRKIRTGRFPPIAALLSEIQDSARSALEEVTQ